MSLSKARELREQRAGIHSSVMEPLIQKGAANWTADDRTKFDAAEADIKRLKEDIDRIERAEELASEMRNAPPAAATKVEATKEERIAKYRAAFWRSMAAAHSQTEEMRGLKPVSAEDRAILADPELRAEATGGGNALQGTGGGYFVDVYGQREVEAAMKYYGPMLASSTIVETATGGPLPWPTVNDTATVGVLIAENTEVTTPTDLASISAVIFNAYKFTTGIEKVSIELLQDAAFNLEAFLRERHAERLGRCLNTYFTTGTGSAQPKGIIPASTSSGQTVIGDDNATSPAPTIEVGYQDLVNLEHSVDPVYRPGSAFMFADSTLQFIRKLKDKYGRPLWQAGMVNGAPDTINGYPFFINNDMATLAATSPVSARKTVLFGRVSKYIVRRVRDYSIARLSERYAEFGQVAFIGFARYDGNLVDAGTHPVKYLTNPAS